MNEHAIAQNLRRIRTEQGVSLSKASELTGVSKAMLGQVERNESSPTVATLWKIVQGFQIPLSALLNGPECAEACSAVQFPGSIGVRVVFPFDANLGEETFEVSLQPTQSHRSDAHVRGMIEDIIVLSGQMEIEVGGQSCELSQGQGFRFAADQPHAYRAFNDGAVFLNIHHYPRGNV